MNYHKIRFISIWFLLFCLLTYFFYSTDLSDFEKKEVSSFTNILHQKESILKGIKREEPFPNYDAKIGLVELISLEYLGTIKKLLKQNDWKKRIQSYPSIFKNHSGLIIGKKNKKFQFKNGNTFEQYFGKKWFKRFFLALRTKGSYFEGMIERIYPYAISFEEFQAKKDLFTILYKNGQFILMMHTESLDKTILLMVHLDKIQYKQLISETLKLFQRSNSNLSLSKQGDLYQVNGIDHLVKKSDLGLKLKLSFPSYIDWLLNHYYLLILFTLIVLYFQFTGGYRVYSVGIEYALIIITIIFCVILNLLNYNIFDYWRFNSMKSDVSDKQSSWRVKSRLMDENFEKFQVDLTLKIKKANEEETIKELSDKNKDWLIFSVDKDMECSVLPSDTKLISNTLARAFSKEIIKNSLKSQNILHHYQKLKNMEISFSNIIASSLIKKNKLVIKRKAYRMFRNKNRLFSKWDDYKDGFYIYWVRLKDWQKLDQFVCVLIPVPIMIRDYLKSAYMSNVSVMIRSKMNKKVVYPQSNYPVSSFDLQKQWLETRNTGSMISNFHYLGSDYTSLFVSSKSLENYSYFFCEKLKNLESKYSYIKDWYIQVQILIWLCALFFCYYLRQILIKPLNDARQFLILLKHQEKAAIPPQYFPRNLGKINQSITLLSERYKELLSSGVHIDQCLIQILDSFEQSQSYECVSLKVFSLTDTKMLYDLVTKYSGYVHSSGINEHTLLYFKEVQKNYIQNALQSALELQKVFPESSYTMHHERRTYNCVNDQNNSIIFLKSDIAFERIYKYESQSILLDKYCCEELRYYYEFEDFDTDFDRLLEKGNQ